MRIDHAHLFMYLCGAPVRPPDPPPELVTLTDALPAQQDVAATFRALVAQAEGFLPARSPGDSKRPGRLAHRWAALMLRRLAEAGVLPEADIAVYLHHAEEALELRTATAELLRLFPEMSTATLRQLTGGSAMTVCRGRRTVSA